MAVPTLMLTNLFIASVMDSVRNSALYRLRKNLLNLLGHDGCVATILGMCLRGRLVGLATGGVNLTMLLVMRFF